MNIGSTYYKIKPIVVRFQNKAIPKYTSVTIDHVLFHFHELFSSRKAGILNCIRAWTHLRPNLNIPQAIEAIGTEEQ